jgi:hypothetical protein
MYLDSDRALADLRLAPGDDTSGQTS